MNVTGAMQMPDEVELDDLSGGKNGTPGGGGGRRKVSALPLSEVVTDPSASPSPRDLVKKTLHQVMRPRTWASSDLCQCRFIYVKPNNSTNH